jgi:DNA-binding HxlR family transcriptional regulator
VLCKFSSRKKEESAILGRMGSKRTYRDGCSSAHALDLVGERWALLIVRDLLFGPKRFTDLQAGLAHGSPNVLSQRLRELEASGIVRRRRLPPPASANVYELTDWGAELEPVLMGLQRWGARSPSFPHEVPVGCDAAMLALKNAFDPAIAGDFRISLEVRFTTDAFRLTVDEGTIDIARGAAERPEVSIRTNPETLEDLAFTGLSVEAAERAGTLTVSGDRAKLHQLFGILAAAIGGYPMASAQEGSSGTGAAVARRTSKIS